MVSRLGCSPRVGGCGLARRGVLRCIGLVAASALTEDELDATVAAIQVSCAASSW